jgi:inhibitor of KinA
LRFFPAGDLAVSVQLGEEISVDVNTRVRALEYLIAQKAVPGVVETVPTYSALLVYYDPSIVVYDTLCGQLAALAEQATTTAMPPAREVELPCCYEGELGPDLEAAAKRLTLSVDELVRLHAGAEYLVYFIGFTPGLPYMTGAPERLTIARLDSPRVKVPAGSVAIGGIQCCVYPVESPGGFWLLGRTPVRLYDPDAAEPILLKPGDRVRFRRIERREYDDIAARVAAGRFQPVMP